MERMYEEYLEQARGQLDRLWTEETINNNSWTLIFIGILFTFRIITFMQREKVTVYFKRGSQVMGEFVKRTKVTQMEYTPYTLTVNGHLQAIMSVICELVLKIRYPIKYKREMFTLSDGGTIAIDWVQDYEGDFPKEKSPRPILCLFAGISGGNDNLYLYSMIKQAT